MLLLFFSLCSFRSVLPLDLFVDSSGKNPCLTNCDGSIGKPYRSILESFVSIERASNSLNQNSFLNVTLNLLAENNLVLPGQLSSLKLPSKYIFFRNATLLSLLVKGGNTSRAKILFLTQDFSLEIRNNLVFENVVIPRGNCSGSAT